MKKIISNAKTGFTLVELLIVIALIGALAIGLFAAIDPIEQIRRGQDTGVRNLAREFATAQNRYYTARGAFTWGNAQTTASLDTLGTQTTTLVDAGELKTNFTSQAGANLSRIYVTGTATTYSVCFQPASKNMQTDPTTTFSQNGGNGAGCGTATSTCYQCFQ